MRLYLKGLSIKARIVKPQKGREKKGRKKERNIRITSHIKYRVGCLFCPPRVRRDKTVWNWKKNVGIYLCIGKAS